MNHIITNFTRGELSPLLYGRVDFDGYYKGAKHIENFVVLPQGGLIRRPGFKAIKPVKDSTTSIRLIPFQFSTEQGYVLEFGHEYIRFYYKGAGRILDGASAYEITSPYDADDLDDIQFAQDADVMWLCHPSYKPRKLSRTGHTSWTLNNYAPASDPFTAADAYPRAVTIYQRRLWFAGTNDDPQTLWATKIGDYEIMTTGASDDDALQFTLGSEQVNVIRWLSSSRVLAAGTLGGIFVIEGGTGSPITPDNVRAQKEVATGATKIRPEPVGSYVFYVQSNDKTIREFKFSFEKDGNIAEDASVLAEHLLKDGIKGLAYQEAPYNVLWVLTKEGDIRAFTRQEEHEVAAWSRIETDGVFESIACIRGDGDNDEIWAVVAREIDGSTVKYVERLAEFDFDVIEDAVRLDCSTTRDNPVDVTSIVDGLVTANGHGFANEDTVIFTRFDDEDIDYKKYEVANSSSNTFDIDATITVGEGEARECTDSLTGLSYLEGKEVDVITDGAVHPKQTVANASISLNWEAGLIHVGLGYESTMKTMGLEVPSQTTSTTQGMQKKTYKVISRFVDTVGALVGSEDQQDTVLFRSVEDLTGVAIPPYTGDKITHFPSSIDNNNYLVIKQEDALPMIITAIIREINVFGGN